MSAQGLCFFAVCRGHPHDESMILVVELGITGEVGDENFLYGVVITLFRQEVMATENAVGVHVDYEDRMITGIKED